MSLTSRGAAILAVVSLLGEVLASYGWLGLKQTSAAAFLVVFAAAVVVFFIGLAFLPPHRSQRAHVELDRLMKEGDAPLQGWQVVEERVYRRERRVIVGPGVPLMKPPISEAQRALPDE